MRRVDRNCHFHGHFVTYPSSVNRQAVDSSPTKGKPLVKCEHPLPPKGSANKITERRGCRLLQVILILQFISAATYFPSADITPNTTKTVGGESSPTVFTFKCALFCFTVYALFRELSLAIAKTFQESFCGAFSKKRPRPRVLASPRIPRVPSRQMA